jgi:serine/threonine protein kinase
MHSRVSDLVSDSKLETVFPSNAATDAHPPVTVHVYLESHLSRSVRRKEAWQSVQRIAHGGFGSIWLEQCVRGGRHNDNGPQLRAVKQIPRATSHRAKSIDYDLELEAIAKFSHWRYERCFVKSFGWYEWSDTLLISMEYLPGGDLHDYLENSVAPIPEAEVQQIAFQLLEGLSFMHGNSFEHRDLKPRVRFVVWRKLQSI